MLKKLTISLIFILLMGLITPFVNTVQAVTNLVVNPSMETADPNNTSLPDSWYQGGWGTNTATYTYSKTGAQSGTKSLTVRVTKYTDGDVKWVSAPSTITPNTTYFFSDYYKATVATDYVAEFSDAQGNMSYQYIGTVAASPTTWKFGKFTFQTPTSAVSGRVFHLINKLGTLQIDNTVFRTADPLNITDNVPNNSFEQTSDTNSSIPAGWSHGGWGTNTANYTYLKTGHTGTKSAKVQITTYTSGDAKWAYQSQPLAPGYYRFTDYYKATVGTRVVVAFTMNDGTDTYSELKIAPSSSSTWAKYTDTFTVPVNTSKVTVFHLLSSVGSLTTDDYSITNSTAVGFNRALVTLTFDDGLISHYQTAFPILQNSNLPATFYILTGSEYLNTNGYLTTSMVQALKDAGEEITSHTISHPHLTTLTTTEVDKQLADSQDFMRNAFGVTSNNLATPYGDYNPAVLAEITKYYTSHRSVYTGFNWKDNFNIYELKVQNILITTPISQVQAWVEQAKQDKTWLILVYHAVDNLGDEYSVTPENFASEIQIIKDSGATVLTLDQALAEILPQVN